MMCDEEDASIIQHTARPDIVASCTERPSAEQVVLSKDRE